MSDKTKSSFFFHSFFGRVRTIIRSSRSYRLRYLPHRFFANKVVKLVEEGDYAIVAFKLILTFLEASHILYYMKLLPAFAKIDPVVA